MHKLTNLIVALRIWSDTKGQDMVEYALTAGFLVVAAAALSPSLAAGVTSIFTSVGSVMTIAAAQGN
jgi:Flp pilus assembly pilin Flp